MSMRERRPRRARSGRAGSGDNTVKLLQDDAEAGGALHKEGGGLS